MIIGDTLYCANVGDSKAVLYRGKDIDPLVLTEDHLASDEKEKERIKSNGGIVVWYVFCDHFRNRNMLVILVILIVTPHFLK